jgi:hypothetical protein
VDAGNKDFARGVIDKKKEGMKMKCKDEEN